MFGEARYFEKIYLDLCIKIFKKYQAIFPGRAEINYRSYFKKNSF
jgi:hypothetical protein